MSETPFSDHFMRSEWNGNGLDSVRVRAAHAGVNVYTDHQMSLHGLTLQRLTYFLEVARTGSFRQAAANLHVQQPGLSAQIDQLEAVLGTSVFERTRRGASLTPVGQQLLSKAQDVVQAAERFQEYSAGLKRGEAGVVSIACYPVHIERMLARVIGAFHEKHPNIRVDLTNVRDDRRRHAGRSLLEELVAGDVDLALAPPNPQLDGVDGMKVWDASIRVVLPDDHPDRAAVEVPITLLRERPVLIAPPDYFTRNTVASAASAAGFSLDVVAESSSPPALIALAINGLGWAVLPDDYSLVTNASPAFPVLTDRDALTLATPVWVHWRREHEMLPATQLFIDEVRHWVRAEQEFPGVAAAGYALVPNSQRQEHQRPTREET